MRGDHVRLGLHDEAGVQLVVHLVVVVDVAGVDHRQQRVEAVERLQPGRRAVDRPHEVVGVRRDRHRRGRLVRVVAGGARDLRAERAGGVAVDRDRPAAGRRRRLRIEDEIRRAAVVVHLVTQRDPADGGRVGIAVRAADDRRAVDRVEARRRERLLDEVVVVRRRDVAVVAAGRIRYADGPDQDPAARRGEALRAGRGARHAGVREHEGLSVAAGRRAVVRVRRRRAVGDACGAAVQRRRDAAARNDDAAAAAAAGAVRRAARVEHVGVGSVRAVRGDAHAGRHRKRR